MPSHFKKYTVESQKIVLKQPMREVPEEKISYDLPELSKTINLAQPGEESKTIQIAQDLSTEEEACLLETGMYLHGHTEI